ncbi:MAG: STAS-like domain-containing protein [Clostridia bacterium]|nr:STAS-like domain-containing protein [Clostridia bacterium]
MIVINISKDFTDTPGARYKSEGEYSGELFRETILIPKYVEAIASKSQLKVELDGGYGYATSFLEESFGGLAREYDIQEVLRTLVFESNDEPGLINEITEYIKMARRERK